jgi:hypothetical protein
MPAKDPVKNVKLTDIYSNKIMMVRIRALVTLISELKRLLYFNLKFSKH